MSDPAPNPEAIRATWRWLAHGPHGVSEVRVIRASGGVVSIGFFDDEESFVRECARCNATGNVYVGIQPRNTVRPLKSGATKKDIEILTATVNDGGRDAGPDAGPMPSDGGPDAGPPSDGGSLSTLAVARTTTIPACTLYVDGAATGTPAGTLSNPYRTIAAAISAASNGAVICVAQGTYAETLIPGEKYFTLAGGFQSMKAFAVRDSSL